MDSVHVRPGSRVIDLGFEFDNPLKPPSSSRVDIECRRKSLAFFYETDKKTFFSK